MGNCLTPGERYNVQEAENRRQVAVEQLEAITGEEEEGRGKGTAAPLDIPPPTTADLIVDSNQLTDKFRLDMIDEYVNSAGTSPTSNGEAPRSAADVASATSIEVMMENKLANIERAAPIATAD